ncbi:MAG: NusG domain II-containing protein [Clostridia bacterium]|nr:NusG domain II-containing protein [Clostridia bacterium]
MRFFKKSDMAMIVIIIALSLILFGAYQFFYGKMPAKAEIYYYSQLVQTIDLSKENAGTFSIPQNEDVVFQITADGQIAFIESSCPDKICIHTGFLQTVGQYAACLPNGIMIKIVPNKERRDDEPDIVIGQ